MDVVLQQALKKKKDKSKLVSILVLMDVVLQHYKLLFTCILVYLVSILVLMDVVLQHYAPYSIGY